MINQLLHGKAGAISTNILPASYILLLFHSSKGS